MTKPAKTYQLFIQEANGEYKRATPSQVLKAAKEAIQVKYKRGASFTNPSFVKTFFTSQLAGNESEVFSAVFLDNQYRLIAYEDLFFGTINSSSVYPREIVKKALSHNAAAVIFAHNHPSGLSDPSQSDRLLTEELKRVLAVIDVKVLDHIVVGANPYSFSENGLM